MPGFDNHQHYDRPAPGPEGRVGGFGPTDDPTLDAIDEALAANRAEIPAEEREQLARAAGSFGAELGERYVGGEEAALADDSDTDGDAMRGGA